MSQGIPGWVQHLMTAGLTTAASGARSIYNAFNDGSLKNGLVKLRDYFSGQSDLDAQTAASKELLGVEQAFNSAEAEKEREWYERLSNTAIQRQVADLKAAGLNPWLALQNGMSGSPVASSMAASSSAGAAGMRSPKWSQLISAAKDLIPGKNLDTGSMVTSALRIAAIALMA